jgi:hypothetical protein
MVARRDERHDVGMKPEQAMDYYEDDEDPAAILREFEEATEGGVTAPPELPHEATGQVTQSETYTSITAGLYGHLRDPFAISGSMTSGARDSVQA